MWNGAESPSCITGDDEGSTGVDEDKLGIGATEGVRAGMLAGGGIEAPGSADTRLRTS